MSGIHEIDVYGNHALTRRQFVGAAGGLLLVGCGGMLPQTLAKQNRQTIHLGYIKTVSCVEGTPEFIEAYGRATKFGDSANIGTERHARKIAAGRWYAALAAGDVVELTRGPGQRLLSKDAINGIHMPLGMFTHASGKAVDELLVLLDNGIPVTATVRVSYLVGATFMKQITFELRAHPANSVEARMVHAVAGSPALQATEGILAFEQRIKEKLTPGWERIRQEKGIRLWTIKS